MGGVVVVGRGRQGDGVVDGVFGLKKGGGARRWKGGRGMLEVKEKFGGVVEGR